MKILKTRFLPLLIIVQIYVISCSNGGDNIKLYKPGIYEYDINRKSYSLIKTFGVSSNSPYFSYYHNDNSKIIVTQYDKISIINLLTKKEVIISLDSLMLTNSFFSLSPTEDKIVFSGFSTDLTIIRNGIYLLDISTKNIQVLKANNDKELPETYSFPTFSNNGKSITYQQFNYGYRDSIRSYFDPTRSIFIFDLQKYKGTKIFSSKDFGVQYSMFDNSDSSLIIVSFPKNLLKINLDTKIVDTIDNSHYFSNGVYLEGYPHILIYKSKLLYSCEDVQTWTNQHNIYLYDFEKKKSDYFVYGIMPMSKNFINGNIIARSSCDYLDKVSTFIIWSEDGKFIESLKSGERAIYSPKGDKILMLTSDNANADDY